jgi:HAD superfamily hydrolase (TIGR01490 family)
MNASTPSTKQRRLALFDFDGTITTRDTLPLFIAHAAPRGAIALRAHRWLPPLMRCALGRITRQQAKEALLATFFQGCAQEALQSLGESFLPRLVDRYIRPAALRCLQDHLDKGARVLIVSASPEEWVRPWALSVGAECIATRLQYREGRFTGFFQGKNCVGIEKARRIKEVVGEINDYYSYAYGDSKGDLPMLALADEGHLRPFR